MHPTSTNVGPKVTSSSLEVAADFESIRAIGPWLRSSVEQLHDGIVDDTIVGSIELAIHEVATNCIDHARAKTLQFAASICDHELLVEIIDDGASRFDGETSVPVPAEPQVRGYGLLIVEQLAQSVVYERSSAKNRWSLRFSLETTSPL